MYLRGTKPKLAYGLKKNWQVNVAKGMLQATALDVLTSSRCGEVSLYEDRSKRIADAYVYSGLGMVYRKLMYGLPLSVVLLNNGVWGCLIRDQRLAPLSRHQLYGRWYGMSYFQWKFDIGCEIVNSVQEEIILCYGLLLPYLTMDGTGSFTREGVYTLVTSEWNEMLHDALIGLQNVIPLMDGNNT